MEGGGIPFLMRTLRFAFGGILETGDPLLEDRLLEQLMKSFTGDPLLEDRLLEQLMKSFTGDPLLEDRLLEHW